MALAALDIETDTSPLTEQEKAAGFTSRGLDPRITEITSIAIALEDGAPLVFDGDEETVLGETINALAEISPSLLLTWNGAVFDLPFIHDRAKVRGLETGLLLEPNPGIVPKYDPTPGHEGGYTAYWGKSTHVDVAYLVKADADARGMKWSLKPYARSIGLDPIEVDRERMHELTPEQLRDYVASDAVVTLEIGKRALGLL